jgi:hypothetical protein
MNDWGERFGWYSSIYVLRGLAHDIYVSARANELVYFANPNMIVAVWLEIMMPPFINVVWVGCVILVLPILPLIKETLERVRASYS